MIEKLKNVTMLQSHLISYFIRPQSLKKISMSMIIRLIERPMFEFEFHDRGTSRGQATKKLYLHDEVPKPNNNLFEHNNDFPLMHALSPFFVLFLVVLISSNSVMI